MNLPSDSSKKLSTPDLIGSNHSQSPIADTKEETHEENAPLNDVDSWSNTVRTKSIVWQHFKKVKVDGKDKVECNYCRKQLVGGSKNGTRHLHAHIKICQRRKYGDVSQKILSMTPGEDSSSKSQMTLTSHQLDQESVRKDLAMMIVLHEYALSMVDHYGFRKFCNNMQPLFKVVSRNTIKKDIFKMYDVEKEKTMKLLNKNRSRIAITWICGYRQSKQRIYDNHSALYRRQLGLTKSTRKRCGLTRMELAKLKETTT
ncbi:hypothetical protein Patl1_05998 [Pistacia atlantica]|uniref:Uncharacterized protein n=1 Tax=Pistacia atlantica TaxID=434234 RepID=A0ACC1BRC1_9ROSI|nr:hypothetical protein Patl1_05998 [Pistacia atlantica]